MFLLPLTVHKNVGLRLELYGCKGGIFSNSFNFVDWNFFNQGSFQTTLESKKERPLEYVRSKQPFIYPGSRFGYFRTVTTLYILTEGLLIYQVLDLCNTQWVMDAIFLVYVFH